MSKNAIVFQPESADQAEGPNHREPAGGIENILDARRDIEAGGEERQAETEDEVAKASSREVK